MSKKPRTRAKTDHQPHLSRFLRWQTEVAGRSQSTVSDYGRSLADWARHVGEGRSLLDVTTSDMETWVTRPRRKRGSRAGGTIGAAATRKRDVAVLRSFYGWCHKQGLTKTDLAAGLIAPTVHNTNPKPLDDAVWRALWASDALPMEHRVLTGLGYYTGLRRAEIAVLRCDQFDLDSQRIVNFRRKGGGEDTTPYGDLYGAVQDKLPHLAEGLNFCQVLADWVTSRSYTGRERGWLFEWRRLDLRVVNRKVEEAINLTGCGHFTPHQLRHSTATNLLRAGVPVQLVSRVMNHSSLEITMRYVRAGADEMAQWRLGLYG